MSKELKWGDVIYYLGKHECIFIRKVNERQSAILFKGSDRADRVDTTSLKVGVLKRPLV